MKKEKIVRIIIFVVIALIILLLLKNCSSNKYKVTFKNNTESYLEVKTNGLVKKPTKMPIKEGYVFVGWYLNDEPFDFDKKIADDTVLVAKWEKKEEKYSVVFLFNDDKNSQITKYDQVTENSVIPTREGYKFLGWFYNGELYDFSKKLDQNITLVAKWEKIEDEASTNKDNNLKPKTPITGIKSKDIKPPTIAKLDVTSNSYSIVVSVDAYDNKTKKNEIKIEYILDGTTYQTSNRFTNLTQDREYKVYIKVTDKSNNSNIVTTNIKTKKLEEITSITPSTLAITNKDIELILNDSIYFIQISNNDIDFEDVEKPIKIKKNGTYYLRYTDRVSNHSVSKRIIINNIDKEKPNDYEINITKTSRKATVVVSTTDNLTLAENLKYSYSLDGITYQNDNNFDNLTAGSTQKIYVKVEDEAGNINIKEKEVVINTIPEPILNISETNITNNNVILTFTNISPFNLQVKDNGNFVNTTSPAIITENKTLVYRYTDGYNNSDEKEVIVNNIDKVLPTLEITKNTSSYNEIKVEINISDNITTNDNLKVQYKLGSLEYQNSNIFRNLNYETEYQVYVRVEDEAGNVKEKDVIVNTKPTPEVGEILVSKTELTKDNITVTVKDKNPNFALEYSLDGNIFIPYTNNVVLSNNATVLFRYINLNMTSGPTKQVTISNIDNTSPTITVDKENTPTYVKEVKVNINVEDLNGVRTKEYSISESNTTPSVYQLLNEGITINNRSGTYYIHVKAEDTVGNISKSVFGPYLLDNEEPVINVNLTGSASNNIRLKVDATDSKSGIKGFYYSKDGGLKYSTLKTSGIYMYTGLKNNTEYKIRVKVEDNLGNVIESDIKPIKTPSLGSISATINDDKWANRKELSISSDQIPEERYFYSMNNGVDWIEITTSSVTQEVLRNMIIKYKVTDGHNEEIFNIEVSKIDTKKPIITKMEEDKSKTKNTTITVNIESEDSGPISEKSGVKAYSYRVNDGAWSEFTNISPTHTYTNLQVDTTYNLGLRVLDNAGNIEEKSIVAKTKFDCYTLNSSGYITGYDFKTCPKNLNIPAKVNNVNVVGIVEKVFYNKGITSVKFSEGIKQIELEAFANNPINQSELILPKSLTKVGSNAFSSNQANYGNVLIKGDTELSTGTFSGSRINNLKIEGAVFLIDSNFMNTTINNIDFGNKIKLIGRSAFYNIKLNQNTLIIPKTVDHIGDFAFKSLSPNANTIHKLVIGAKNIGKSAFYDTSINEIEFSNTVSILESAFERTGVRKINLFPETLKVIKQFAFRSHNLDIDTLLIPESVIVLETHAFSSNNKFKINHYKHLSNVSIPTNLFASSNSTIKIVDIEKANTIGAGVFSYHNVEKLTLGEGIVTIESSAFQGNQIKQETLVIPASVKNIKFNAFLSTDKIIDINKLTILGEAIIGNRAFARGVFKNVDIRNVKSIGSDSFGSSNIVKLIFSNKITTIGSGAFSNNKFDIDTLVIPESVTSFANSFNSSGKINTLKWESSYNVPNSAFRSTTINNIIIKKAEEIGDFAFYQTKWSTIDLGTNMKKIGQNGIALSSSDTNITIIIPSSMQEMHSTSLNNVVKPKIIIKKPEGSLANAPWGSLNSTIIYEP